MLTGIIFDIREFTVHDGPGIRTTVFLKGCPLRCAWCHNPEGMTSHPEWMESRGGKRLVGRTCSSADLAALLNRQVSVLRLNHGGLTFSGGEPLAQAAFLAEVIALLDDVHVVLDTSGYAPAADFQLVAERCDLIHYDLKLIDAARHREFTGVDNAPILANLRRLAALQVPYVIRVPLVPGVTDTEDNLSAMAATLRGLPGLVRVDLLAYNRAAGAKFNALGRTFCPPYSESIPVQPRINLFEEAAIPVHLSGSVARPPPARLTGAEEKQSIHPAR